MITVVVEMDYTEDEMWVATAVEPADYQCTVFGVADETRESVCDSVIHVAHQDFGHDTPLTIVYRDTERAIPQSRIEDAADPGRESCPLCGHDVKTD
jgi:hypothetical protein